MRQILCPKHFLTVSSISCSPIDASLVHEGAPPLQGGTLLRYSLAPTDVREESSFRTLPDFGALNTDDIALFAVDGTELMGKRARAEGATEALIIVCSELIML